MKMNHILAGFRQGAVPWALVVLGLNLMAFGTGCQSTMSLDSRVPDMLADSEETVAEGTPAAPRSADARLRPGLSIGMSVLVGGKKEIDEPAKRITEKGTIVLPLLGELPVADLTLDELREQLGQKYRKYFVDPQIILDFASDTTGTGEISPWGFLTVLGRVNSPGRVAIPATRDLTVSGAIQKAGGFASSAKSSAILVSRPMPDGQVVTRTINLNEVGRAGRLEEDIVLEADDVVFVPEAVF